MAAEKEARLAARLELLQLSGSAVRMFLSARRDMPSRGPIMRASRPPRLEAQSTGRQAKKLMIAISPAASASSTALRPAWWTAFIATMMTASSEASSRG
jgi:fructose-specific phosphotransferase system IIC component